MMIKIAALPIILLSALTVAAQKPNDVITKQIKALRAGKAITLSYDAAGNTSKIMVTAENFADADARRAGIKAMNFGMAVFYPGKELPAVPETLDFAFWILTIKPQFAASHVLKVTLAREMLDLGDARYGAKPRENMEYLNFKISRADLTKIAAESSVKFKLGGHDFTFTPTHLITLKNLLAISDIR